jgi:hypothetical protein
MTRGWERGLDYMTQMEQQLITRKLIDQEVRGRLPRKKF